MVHAHEFHATAISTLSAGRYDPGCATRHDPDSFDAHADCQHGMVAAVLAMTDRGPRLRDNHRSRSELAQELKDNSQPWP